MHKEFEFASGTVIGAIHREEHGHSNGHDALEVLETPWGTICLVLDGCGSGAHSEVGAKIGIRLLMRSFTKHLRKEQDHARIPAGKEKRRNPYPLFRRVREDVLAQIRVIALQMDDNLSWIMNEYFLFTIVGAIITSDTARFFSIGDGVIFVNGEKIHLIYDEFGKPVKKYPDDAPPYLCYGLTESSLEKTRPDLLRFMVHRFLGTESLHSFLIGTDGVEDLMKVENSRIPGKRKIVGPVSQFWQEDRYFRNSDLVRRHLALAAENHVGTNKREPDVRRALDVRLVSEKGLLPDDTTLISGRRKKGGT